MSAGTSDTDSAPKVPWSVIREAVRRRDAWDMYNHDAVVGRHGSADPSLVREFAARIRHLDTPGREPRRDGLAADLDRLADQYAPPADLAATLRATIADLDGHIARHAAQIAAQHIAASAAEVAAARLEVELAEEAHRKTHAQHGTRIDVLVQQVNLQRERAEKAEALLVQAEDYVRELQDAPDQQ